MELYDRVTSELSYKNGRLYWKRSGKEAGSVGRDNRVRIRLDGKSYLRYRLVWLMHHKEWPSVIDHVDGDSVNDKLENLRNCTQRENRMNSRAASRSGYKGVHWANGVWCSRIKLNGKTVRLGYSSDPIECAKMYDKAATEMFGEYAKLNFKEV